MIGRSVDVDRLSTLPEVVEELLYNNEFSRDTFEKIRQKYIYNIGHSGEVGAEYIMERLDYYKKKHAEEDDY